MNRIRALREDRDLRQIDVAKATGIDQKTLSNYETGKTNPDSFAILTLAKFFHVSTDYLLCNEQSNQIESLLSSVTQIQQQLEQIKSQIKQL